MSIVFCGIAPHPPIAVPGVGRGGDKEIKDTQQSMLELGRRLKEKEPEVLILITPHGPVFSDAIGVYAFERMQGDLANFGAPTVNFDFENHRLADVIMQKAAGEGVPVLAIDDRVMKRMGMNTRLDHGVMVPLYFLMQAAGQLPLVVVSIGMLTYREIYRMGVLIQKAVQKIGVRAGVIASADLSHRLIPDAPAGYDPAGAEFDREIVRITGEGDAGGLFALEPDLIRRAGECGLRPIIMAFGAVDGLKIAPEVLSYQGPFGVGYMVADLKPGQPDPGRCLLESQNAEDPIAGLARKALENYYRGTKDRNFDIPKELLTRKAGAFVTINKNGRLRGCIGTIEPVYDNLAEEIMANAISAGTRDSRFGPVTADELGELSYSVDVLEEAEAVASMDDLDPKIYGVIVSLGWRKGLLLPNLDGIDTAREQVAIARQKAGIAPHEKVQLERFKVTRYK